MVAPAGHGVGMARTSTSAHRDLAATMSTRRISGPTHDGAPSSARTTTGLADGTVLFDGRVAQIAGFESGTVKLRFTDGGEVRVALAEYVRRARAVDAGPGATDAPPSVPWHPTGQRAHHVRKLLDGYAAGRQTALRELRDRSRLS